MLTGCNKTTSATDGTASATGTAASSTDVASASGTSTTGTTGTTSSRSSTSSSTNSTAPESAASPPASADKSADVSWTAPTTNTNGSALTDLAGYTIYYGTSPGALTQTVNVPSAGAIDYIVQGLSQGTWYFAVAAYTNTGLQSSFSTVVSKTIT
jgi:hypothetical protein